MNNKGELPEGAMEEELRFIKRLLALWLLKSGATQDEIGAALEIDQSAVSRMFKGVKIKRFNEAK